MMIRTFAIAGAFAAAALLASSAQAAPITLYNTGVDAGGALQANNSSELHYALSSDYGTYVFDVRTADASNGYPIGPWVADDAFSTWIGPVGDSQLNGPVGNYDYRYTFSLAGLSAATAQISGRWTSDNQGYDILINGHSTGAYSAFLENWTNFSITSGFVAGANTIDFLVTNQGGPTGLRIEMSGAAAAVPEPASWALMIGGFGLAGAALRRRRSAAATA